MPEREGPKVVLRGPAEGETIILPMGRQRARITRKASRTETGGHWAIGEAWQDPASTTHRTRMMKQKPSTSLKVATPSTPAPLPRRGLDQAHSSSFRLAPCTGSEQVQKAGGYFVSGRRPSKPLSLVDIRRALPTSSHAALRRFSGATTYGRRRSEVPLTVHPARRRGNAALARSDVCR